MDKGQVNSRSKDKNLNKNKKLPEIRQTLTSKYRMLKANPLLAYGLDRKESLGVKSLQSKTDPLIDLLKRNPALSLDSELSNGFIIEKTAAHSKPKQRPNVNVDQGSKPTNHLNNSRVEFSANKKLPSSTPVTKQASGGPNNFITKNKMLISNANKNGFRKPETAVRNPGAVPRQRSKPSTAGEFKKPESAARNTGAIPKQMLNSKSSTADVSKRMSHTSETAPKKQTNSTKHNPDTQKKEKPKAPLRRSLSAQHIEHRRSKDLMNPEQCFTRLNQSSHSSRSLEDCKINTIYVPDVSPVIEEESLTFRTPGARARRSVVTRTPCTSAKKSNFLRFSTPHNYADLRKRLDDWLKRRGKSLSDYHHLKCFDLSTGRNDECKDADEEDKENIETIIPDNDSYENLHIPQINIEDEEQGTKAVESKVRGKANLNMVASEALMDLHKLILEGYPREQCEVWLSLMQRQVEHLEEESQYWECRAAIEQARGNITSAVECYKTAIVQGAEVKAVDKSLDQLLQKFSLLNISTNDDATTTKERARIMRDARNVFKSSIIQFAVQERKLKKNNKTTDDQKLLVCTPVRRSTRRSRSHYTSTPGVTVYSSLQEVDSPVRNSISFHCNKALK